MASEEERQSTDLSARTPTTAATGAGKTPPGAKVPEAAPGSASTSTSAPSIPSTNRSEALKAKIEEKKKYSTLARSMLVNLKEKTLEPVTIDEAFVVDTALAMAYDSFDPQLIKIEFLRVTGGSAKRVLSVAMCAVFFGNNPYDRVKKAVDPAYLEPIMQDIRIMEVQRKKTSSKSLTLARFGQSHPVLMLKVREYMHKKGVLAANGIATSEVVEPKFQDLSLTPLSEMYPEVKPFLKGFSKALFEHWKRLNKDAKKTEDEWMVDQEKFRAISTASFLKDDQFGNMKKEAINALTLGQTLALLSYK